MTETATLPIWVLLLFCIAFVGFITLIYSHGNWRTTLAFVGLAIIAVLVISGIDAWSAYIKAHFVGRFDQLGIPFREAGPGFSLLPASWPLWLVPTGIFAILATGLGWWLHQSYAPAAETKPVETPAKEIITSTTIPREPVGVIVPPLPGSMQKSVARQLELESLKHELASTKEKLATAIEIAEEQVDKNQDLEIQIAQMEEEQEEMMSDMQDRVTALELEISAKETQSDELTSLALQQAEEIAKLKEQFENS